MVKDHSNIEKGNPLPPHGVFSNKGGRPESRLCDSCFCNFIFNITTVEIKKSLHFEQVMGKMAVLPQAVHEG